MIKIIRANGANEFELINSIKKRNEENDIQAVKTVEDIISNVKTNGDKALIEYTKSYDGAEIKEFEVEKEDIDKAVKEVEPAFIKILQNAASNIRDFHERQVRQSWFKTKEDGSMVGQMVRGLNRVGIYVPGGTAAYPSSVLMNAIPAKIAGVNEIIMVTPPSKDGSINKNILAAASIAGVDRVFAVGGAQAVAALAFGTETIPKVDKIVGPGNIYVATAKRMLYGVIDIDMIAGPSEILIIADETADPEFLAADLMSQAEHDVLASSILICLSKNTAEKTADEIERQIKKLERKDIIKRSLNDYSAIIISENIDKSIELANILAPEHLEIMTQNPFDYLGKIENAGSIFLGKYAPEPLGDYFAGPNHVLPTSGTARFFSPLSVDSFIKTSGVIYYTENALKKVKDEITLFAETEGLTAHANSIKVRFE